jgi:hypothetical protein
MTISHTSYKKRQRDEEEREVDKSIQKKTEDYERSRDEKYKLFYPPFLFISLPFLV